MKETIEKDVLSLRAKGYTIKQICEELNCSEYAVDYWLYPKYREKIRAQQKERRKRANNWRAKLQGKIDRFKDRKISTYVQAKNQSWDKILARKIRDFRSKCLKMSKFGIKEVLEKFGTKTKCYLTGRDIDITKDDYNLDHKIPVVQGGEGTLENLGFTIPIANASKFNMTLEEYLNLCEEVLRYHKPELFKDNKEEIKCDL